LTPFVETVSRQERAKLTNVFEQLAPVLQAQVAISREIAEDSRTILHDYARWFCGLSITNFGATAFVAFRDRAWLHLSDEGMKPIRLLCDLAQRDKDGDWVPSDAVVVVQPGTTQQIGILTHDIQKDMDSGHLVRATYEAGTGSGRVELEVLGLASIGRRRLFSEASVFAQRSDQA
jgi:hypothetical protein